MGNRADVFYELQFEKAFFRSKGMAFQDVFTSIMSKVYPGDFVTCVPWGNIGDLKNDGYLKSARTLFQVYAPATMRSAKAISKIEADFSGALLHWKEHFDTWVLVHNSREGLPPLVLQKLLDLERDNHPIRIDQWAFEELVGHFRKLSPEALRSLYGSPPTSGDREADALRAKRNRANDLAREGKTREAVALLTDALAVAKAVENVEEELELLLALALLSSERQGVGDRQHYLKEADKKVNQSDSIVAKVLYLRAKAAALEDERDYAGAEDAYREALRCCVGPDDDKENLATQGCVTRASLIHILCSANRVEEARDVLTECEGYARQNPEAREGELLHAALEAGIHFSVRAGDESGAISRIGEMEKSATTVRLADRVAGDLSNIANEAAHHEAYQAALAAAEGAVRLGRRAQSRSPTFLPGALYTEAMVIFKMGEHAKALRKASALIDLCNAPENLVIKQAAQHLIAEINRISGDSETAVEFARAALAQATGRPEDIAFAKCALARALYDNGQTEEALKQTKEAWTLAENTVPTSGAVEILSQIANYASQLGADEDVAEASKLLAGLAPDADSIKSEKKRAVARVRLNREMRKRLRKIVSNSGRKSDRPPPGATLQEANAAVTRQLVHWWDDIVDGEPECVAGAYEAWGREHFSKLVQNASRYPESFNLCLEVRSLDDIERSIRLWGLYADFLVLVWKGPTNVELSKTVVPLDYEARGIGDYVLFLGTVLKKTGSDREWAYALGMGPTLPPEVTLFLATRARDFVQSGRLIVVPAVGVGCVNPGHGPFEQLLADSCNAFPGVRRVGIGGTMICQLPYSPDAPFEFIADMAQAETDRLRKLRLALLKRGRQLLPETNLGLEARLLSEEITDALRDLEGRNAPVLRRKGLKNIKEPIAGSVAPFPLGKSLSVILKEPSPYAPLFLLKSFGYACRVDGPYTHRLSTRYEPAGDERIGYWLEPEKSQWRCATLDQTKST